MRKAASFAFAAVLVCVSAGSVVAQHGGNQGSGDSGGERPYGGNVFRENEQNQTLAPEGASAYQVGLHLLQDRKYGEAVPHLSAAVASNPGDAAAWFYLGYAHQQIADGLAEGKRDDERDAAMRAYRRALTLDPNIKSAHQYLGVLYLIRKDPDAAASQAKALERLCPSGCDERAGLDAAIAKYQRQ